MFEWSDEHKMLQTAMRDFIAARRGLSGSVYCSSRKRTEEMAAALDDVELHRFIGGRPATEDELRSRYQVQSVGRSPDGGQGWLNWVVRVRETGVAVGTVQATVTEEGAELAWVVSTRHQGQGYAVEAATGMAAWLRGQGVRTLIAHVHPDHEASARVAARLGLRPTGTVHDGETLWTTALTDLADAGPTAMLGPADP